MAKNVILAVFVCLFCFSWIPIASAGSCNDLTIKLEAKDWSVDKKYLEQHNTCNHGTVSSYTTTMVYLTNVGAYGPDCRVSFLNPQGKAASLVEFQQNYCYLAAGNITVTTISGVPPKYVIKKGSYAAGRGGEVFINGFYKE